MNSLPRNSERFRSRFALESFDEGGVLVDLESGTYFELNMTATEACGALFESQDPDQAIVRLGERLVLHREDAQALLDSVLDDLDQTPGARPTLAGPFRYVPRGDIYTLEDDGRRVLEIDARGGHLRLCVAPPTLRFPMLEYVRAVTPKILGLCDITVLHASACSWSGHTMGFSGASGAGKTTTMRSFVAAGAVPISEDLVVLATDQAEPKCYVEGEMRAHTWAAEAAGRLAQYPSERIPFPARSGIAVGPIRVVDQICFVDSTRRCGDQFAMKRLGRASGLIAVLQNTFLGAADARTWARQLHTLRCFATTVNLFEATVPDGLSALAYGARTYVTNSAS